MSHVVHGLALHGATLLATIALILAAPGFALAQCAFDAPTKKTTFRASLVRVFHECPDLDVYPIPNTSTSAGAPACSPVTPSSPWSFSDESGKCDIRFDQKVFDPCPNDAEPSCAVVRSEVRCSGILDPDGQTLTNTSAWTQEVVLRLTVNDGAGGDMAIVDMPATVTLPPAVDGALRARFDAFPCTSIDCAGEPVPFEWIGIQPSCAQLEIVSMTLRSPDGEAFATLGSSTR